MQYRKLGNSDLEVSVLAFGSWQLGDPGYWGEDAQADAAATVDVALDAGINLFDTADSYGNGESERVLGKLLGARRDQVLIASKMLPNPELGPEQIRKACEASLERLGTDRIDLYQIHWPIHHFTSEAAFEALSKLRDEGKIRHIGLSNYGVRDLTDWMAVGDAVSNQMGYNLAFRAIEYQIVPACKRFGLGILAYSPLLQGILSGRWHSLENIPEARRRTRHFSLRRSGTRHGESGCERMVTKTLMRLKRYAGKVDIPMSTLALGWVMAQPGVSSVIIGARNAAQLERNLAPAHAETQISPAAIAILNEISVPLKRFLGTNADMWQGAGDSRVR